MVNDWNGATGGPTGNGITNGGTMIGVPGTGATPTTMPGTLVTNMTPAAGSIAMPVTGPPIAPSRKA